MLKIYALRVRNDPFINYTYLLVNTRYNESIIIDPGWEPDTVIRYIRQTKSVLRGVLLTHHHRDHTQLAPMLAAEFRVPVLMGDIEKECYNFRCPNLKTVLSDRSFAVGSFEILPYHTPGHTKGSLCFKIDRYIFTGDTLFIEGCGACTGETEAKEMFSSLQRLKASIEPSSIIYPGHSFGISPGITFTALLEQNIYCHLNDEAKFVAFRLRKNQKGIFNFK